MSMGTQMIKQILARRLIAAWSNFKRANAGNVATTFALSTIPIVGFVGSAVDFSRANSTKAAMQSAIDATALMLSKTADSMTAAQVSTKATATFNALFNRPEAKNVVITASYSTTNGSQILLNGTADVPTNFMGLMGFNNMPIAVTSTAKWGMNKLRVALALDVTGSMDDDGKMTALKTATKNLLTQLKAAATKDGDVYVSIVPFAKSVNVGKSNYNANWIDWTEWDDDNGDDVSTTTCTKNGKKTKCTTSTTWVPDNHNTWNGCVTERGPANAPGNSNWDQVVTLPNGTAISKWPAEQYDACPAQMKGLTYDWTALNSLVDSLRPNGGTNQPIGLVWAWQSLVGGGPLTAPAKDPNYIYSDVIILMSDGLNTQNRWYGNGSTQSTAVDNRMYQNGNGSGTCANAKAAGVTIYTVQVNTGGDPTSTLLRNCASGSDKFTEIKTANQLISTFQSIGTALSKLRLAN
jgi:Flp pilus assembly protein TadG